VPVSEEILKASGEHYRRIRNTLRFLLANLYDYEGYDGELDDLDHWAVQTANSLVDRCLDAYAAYDFTTVFRLVHEFCDHDMSSFYLDAIKDRMYCDGKEWPTRRSSQKACHQILLRLTKVVAPILMHTAEETYERIPAIERKSSVHLETLVRDPGFDAAKWTASETFKRIQALRSAMGYIYTHFDEWKKSNGNPNSQDVDVTINSHSITNLERLVDFGEMLPLLLRFASVVVVDGPAGSSEPPTFRTSELLKCERSRVRRADVEPTQWNGSVVPLSARDRRALGIG
jgi:isoleucyl-tRNA synthetase